ncbi:MAG: hypothetical protein ACREQ9_19365 [Candidatus Binatia bacterium]
MRHRAKFRLSDDDLRYQYRVMVRWCRLFRRTDLDWVELAARRYRERHPVIDLEPPARRAA